jgi:hypothetical protein
MPSYDITDDIPLDLSTYTAPTKFTPTDTAYDLSIDDVPFVMNISNQNPYRRETAPYKKEQFDNSSEPGEQSLTGWWLRSQTSFHNGSGLKFYEPGIDYGNVSHRFADSRGVDVWTVGEAKLLNDTFHSYTGDNGIIAIAGRAPTGLQDYIVSADSAGSLKVLTLNGDNAATVVDRTSTLSTNHTSANPFKAITSDGTRYYAVCDVAIHSGNIDGTDILSGKKDISIARHATGGIHSIKYTKGFLMFGEAHILRFIPLATPLVDAGHSGSANQFPNDTVEKRHENPSFAWNVIEGGNTRIYAAGFAGSDSEIWAVPFEETDLVPNVPAAVQVAQLPYGEIVQAMQFYLGYLMVGTNKGVRVARVSEDGSSLTLGPLLFDYDYTGFTTQGVTDFVATGNYVYATTTVQEGTVKNAILVRVDLSTPFEDGTFAYAYDLQYQSDENSYGIGVLYADDRLHLIVNEGSTTGEIQTEKLSQKRASGWLKTGKIRYGTIEPKWFRYINVQCETGQGDTISAYAVRENGDETNIANLSVNLSNQDVFIANPTFSQESLSFKFVLNNKTDDSLLPILKSYQIKSLPAGKRQRLIQYPLSCYDNEMDKFNNVFGYTGRAISTIQRLESIEQTGKFVNVTDYRTGEEYEGVIEEVRFINESSADKNNSGFGGLLLVTVRKL